jgi:hypothetical protein
MTKAEEYERRANECLAVAAQIRDPMEKTELERIAQTYMRLAAHAKNQEEPDA